MGVQLLDEWQLVELVLVVVEAQEIGAVEVGELDERDEVAE
jgi:hypothetical protein